MQYNILVIDDSKQTANDMAEALRMLGHTVTIAFSPRSALMVLSEVIPDLVFLDISMPGVDGLEVCRYLRRDPFTATIPIIICSANSEQTYKDAAKAAGANGYLVKPAYMDDMDRAIEQVLKQKPL
jgi:twitching motility two-component system response regulator PilH